MRNDDRHVGEVGRDIVNVDGVRVLEFETAAARHARTDSRVTGVKNCRQLMLGDDLVKLIGHSIVWEEALQSRMELKTSNYASFDEVTRLTHAHAALMRVDRRKGNHHVGVRSSCLSDFIIGTALVADLELAIDREHDKADFALTIIRDRLGDG